MPVEQELLEILVCPESRQPLRLASAAEIEAMNQRVAQGEVKNRKGEAVKIPLEGGLVREDGKLLYPIRDDIPDLLIDEGIEL